jgi:predicted transposase YbfD/YdcC
MPPRGKRSIDDSIVKNIQFPLPKELKSEARFKNLNTIGLALSESKAGDDEAIDVRPAIRSGISSLKMGVKQFFKAIRSQWQIENSCHWSLDVMYREDDSRTRNRRLAENLAWLRRLTLSLLKQHPGKQSPKNKTSS